MGRNVYSLVLIDDVVDAIDKIAYAKKTSRSNMINQILAEYCSFSTPEMRMRDIFESVERMMTDWESFQVQLQPSDAMISIRSALRYRYKPTIRYMLELYRVCGPTVGELRVSMRTQSETLIQILDGFFSFWLSLENKYIGSFFPHGKVYCEVTPGRYARQFLLPHDTSQQTNELIAAAISDYIHVFDTCMKIYFSQLDNLDRAFSTLEKNYTQYIKNSVIM
nr:CopG family transcriptional regulator [uncultured Caproiciproducens sp.]